MVTLVWSIVLDDMSKIFSLDPVPISRYIDKSNFVWKYTDKIATSESTVIIFTDLNPNSAACEAHRNIFVSASSCWLSYSGTGVELTLSLLAVIQ